jgi:hypothetical protein
VGAGWGAGGWQHGAARPAFKAALRGSRVEALVPAPSPPLAPPHPRARAGLDALLQRVLNARVGVIDVPRRREGGGGSRIVTAFIPFRDAKGKPARCTLLYSHG